MQSADALVRLMIHLRDEVIPVVPAIVPGEIVERPKGGSCLNRKCRRGRPIQMRATESGRLRWICARCKTAWRTKPEVVAVHGSSRGAAPHEASIFRVAMIARALEALPLWTRRTLIGYVHLERLQHLVRNVPAGARSRRQAIRDFEDALGRASSWERKLVGACARVLARAEDDGAVQLGGLRKAAVLSEAFRQAFPRADGAPTSTSAVKDELRVARQQLEKRWGNAA